MKTLDIKVIPGAKRDCWKDEDGGVKVYLAAPAVEGKANKALIDFLARHFDVRRGQVEIIRGLTSRRKTVRIHSD